MENRYLEGRETRNMGVWVDGFDETLTCREPGTKDAGKWDAREHTKPGNYKSIKT